MTPLVIPITTQTIENDLLFGGKLKHRILLSVTISSIRTSNRDTDLTRPKKKTTTGPSEYVGVTRNPVDSDRPDLTGVDEQD